MGSTREAPGPPCGAHPDHPMGSLGGTNLDHPVGPTWDTSGSSCGTHPNHPMRPTRDTTGSSHGAHLDHPIGPTWDTPRPSDGAHLGHTWTILLSPPRIYMYHPMGPIRDIYTIRSCFSQQHSYYGEMQNSKDTKEKRRKAGEDDHGQYLTVGLSGPLMHDFEMRSLCTF